MLFDDTETVTINIGGASAEAPPFLYMPIVLPKGRPAGAEDGDEHGHDQLHAARQEHCAPDERQKQHALLLRYTESAGGGDIQWGRLCVYL